MSISNGIQHPENFYIWGSSWYTAPPAGYSYRNFWSADNEETYYVYNDKNVVKTIYDPCPAGFKIPPSNGFTGFTIDGENNTTPNVTGAWDHGWYFNNNISTPNASIYFPATGYRSPNDGSLIGVGGYAYYWTATPKPRASKNEVPDGCQLDFDWLGVAPKHATSTGAGCAIRPTVDL